MSDSVDFSLDDKDEDGNDEGIQDDQEDGEEDQELYDEDEYDKEVAKAEQPVKKLKKDWARLVFL